jgi:phosphoglycolate phosphatase
MMMSQFKGHIVFDWEGTCAMGVANQPYSLFEGIEQLFSQLKREGYALYIWTSRTRPSLLRILDEFKVRHYFIEVNTSSDNDPKPNPVGLESMLADFPKDKIIHCGDSYTDLMGAKKFGIKVVAPGWNPYLDHDTLTQLGIDFIAKSPVDFFNFIQNSMKE